MPPEDPQGQGVGAELGGVGERGWVPHIHWGAWGPWLLPPPNHHDSHA